MALNALLNLRSLGYHRHVRRPLAGPGPLRVRGAVPGLRRTAATFGMLISSGGAGFRPPVLDQTGPDQIAVYIYIYRYSQLPDSRIAVYIYIIARPDRTRLEL